MSWKPPKKPASGGNFVPVFKEQQNVFYPSGKNSVVGVLLPAFDFDHLGEDMDVSNPLLKKSWTPYRDRTEEMEEGHYPLSPVCSFVLKHRYFGSNKSDIISPKSKQNLIPVNGTDTDYGDPIIDILNTAQDDPRWQYLLGDPKDRDSQKLQYPSTRLYFNIIGADQTGSASNNWKVGVMEMPKTCRLDFEQMMNVMRPASVPEPRDPDWPDYLFGDVTNPNRPLIFRTKMKKTGNENDFCGLNFSNNLVSLQGIQHGPVVSESYLEKRVNLWDPSVYNIMSYQEILDMLLADPIFPNDLIHTACGHRITGPVASGSTGAAPAGNFQSPQQVGYGAPPAQPPQQGGYGVPPAQPPQQGGYGVPPAQPPQQGGYGEGGAQESPRQPAFAEELAADYGMPPAQPPQQEGYGAPPAQPPQQEGYGAPSLQAPPQQGGYGAPPAQPPQQGGYGAPPAQPPQQGGYGAPPAQPPQQGGYGAPPAQPPQQGGYGDAPQAQPSNETLPPPEVTPQGPGMMPPEPPSGAAAAYGTPSVAGSLEHGQPMDATPKAGSDPNLTEENKVHIDSLGQTEMSNYVESYMSKMIGEPLSAADQANLQYAVQVQTDKGFS